MRKGIMNGMFSLLLSITVTPPFALGEEVTELDAATESVSVGHAVVDDAQSDPPGVLDDIDTASIVDLAARLSMDRSWLNEATLESLERGSLRLHELFADAPTFFTKDGTRLFRVEVDRVGSVWEHFDPQTDPFAVYLTHETFTGLGRDRVLALVEGQQTVLFEHDLDTFHLFALSVQDHPADLPLAKSASIASFEEPVVLGQARLEVERFDSERFDLEPINGFSIAPTKLGCAHEFAPSSCNGMQPVCGAGSSLHFVLTQLRIKTDHEGLFKGNPEIELFPLNVDGASTGTTSNLSTPFIFNGRTITDSAGRSRFLPDVNAVDLWYTIDKGAAICRGTLGSEWAVTLVEQDDTVGVLKMKGDTPNKVKTFLSVTQWITKTYQLDFLKFAVNFVQLLLGLFSGDGDDLFQKSIGLTGDLYCNDGLNQPFPRVFNLASAEWNLRGYFACVNPSCVELTASVSGPRSLSGFQAGTYSASVSGGVTPFTYRWTKNGSFVGSGSSVTVSDVDSFTIAVTVTDAAGQTVTASKNVIVTGGTCGEVLC